MKLKPCPCGNENVYIERKPLWHDNHGYKNSYEYTVKCDNPKCIWQPKFSFNNTIYRTDDEARNNTIEQWNNRTTESFELGSWYYKDKNE